MDTDIAAISVRGKLEDNKIRFEGSIERGRAGGSAVALSRVRGSRAGAA
jgi:hypothetical protein